MIYIIICMHHLNHHFEWNHPNNLRQSTQHSISAQISSSNVSNERLFEPLFAFHGTKRNNNFLISYTLHSYWFWRDASHQKARFNKKKTTFARCSKVVPFWLRLRSFLWFFCRFGLTTTTECVCTSISLKHATIDENAIPVWVNM